MVSYHELLLQYKSSFQTLLNSVKDTFSETEYASKLNVDDILMGLPSVRPPLLKEGTEASKAIAKASFRQLASPVQNLVFGLTEVESSLSKCRALQFAEHLENLLNEVQSQLDSYQTVSNVLYDRVLFQFQECEQRLVSEWNEKVEESLVADAAQKVTSFVKELDAQATQFATSHESVYEMYVDLRSWDTELSEMVSSNNVQSLQKKTLETQVHSRECYEFLKRQSVGNLRRKQIQVDLQSVSEEGTLKAKGRLGLHSLYADRRQGKVIPSNAKDVDQWTANLTRLREAEDAYLHQLDRPASEKETIRSGFEDTDWNKLSESLLCCENVMKELQQKTSAIKISLSHRQRKIQRALWEPQSQKLTKMKMHIDHEKQESFPAGSPSDYDKLQRAKQLMIDELSKLQKTFSFKMSDIDLIFQSVSSGIELSEQSKLFESSRETKLSIEKKLRSLAEFQMKMSAILC